MTEPLACSLDIWRVHWTSITVSGRHAVKLDWDGRTRVEKQAGDRAYESVMADLRRRGQRLANSSLKSKCKPLIFCGHLVKAIGIAFNTAIGRASNTTRARTLYEGQNPSTSDDGAAQFLLF